jgi:hypothetical protein
MRGPHLVLGEAHLRRNLKSHADDYNGVRTHRSLNKDAPVSRSVQRTNVISSRAVLADCIIATPPVKLAVAQPNACAARIRLRTTTACIKCIVSSDQLGRADYSERPSRRLKAGIDHRRLIPLLWGIYDFALASTLEIHAGPPILRRLGKRRRQSTAVSWAGRHDDGSRTWTLYSYPFFNVLRLSLELLLFLSSCWRYQRQRPLSKGSNTFRWLGYQSRFGFLALRWLGAVLSSSCRNGVKA